jgi:hypothetical protein
MGPVSWDEGLQDQGFISRVLGIRDYRDEKQKGKGQWRKSIISGCVMGF